MPQEEVVTRGTFCHDERWLCLQGQITPINATNFGKHIEKLAKENTSPIVVFLESPGGDVFACLKIYHLIEKLRGKGALVYTVGRNIARSGAFFILQAGTQRFATDGTSLVFHRAIRTYTDRTMNSTELAEELYKLEILDAEQMLIFEKHGHPIHKIHDLFLRNAKIGARTAQKLNLVDTIIPNADLPELYARITRPVS